MDFGQIKTIQDKIAARKSKFNQDLNGQSINCFWKEESLKCLSESDAFSWRKARCKGESNYWGWTAIEYINFHVRFHRKNRFSFMVIRSAIQR